MTDGSNKFITNYACRIANVLNAIIYNAKDALVEVEARSAEEEVVTSPWEEVMPQELVGHWQPAALI